jgi:hypothetical protein
MGVENVNRNSKPKPKFQDLSGLPLFDWRQAVLQPPRTRAGLHLARRYRLHPSIADVVAALAGLGSDWEGA